MSPKDSLSPGDHFGMRIVKFDPLEKVMIDQRTTLIPYLESIVLHGL